MKTTHRGPSMKFMFILGASLIDMTRQCRIVKSVGCESKDLSIPEWFDL